MLVEERIYNEISKTELHEVLDECILTYSTLALRSEDNAFHRTVADHLYYLRLLQEVLAE